MNTCSLSKTLALGLGLLALTSCGKSKPQIQNAPAADPYFSAVAEQTRVGDDYHVQLKWGTGDTPLLWIIDRFEKYTGSRQSTVVDGSTHAYIDNEVTPGSFYTYYLVSQGPFKYALKTQVLIPCEEEK